VTTATKKKIQRRRQLVRKLITKKVRSVKMEKRSRSVVERITWKLPFASPQAVVRELAAKHNITVGATTVRRDCRALGIKARVRPKRPWHSTEDQAQRFRFSKRMMRVSKEKLATLHFSDEKWFDSDDHGNRFQWCSAGEHPVPRGSSQFPKKVHVWCCIGVGFRKIVFHSRPEDEPGAVKYGPGRPRKGEKRPPKDKRAKKELVNSSVYIQKCLRPVVAQRRKNAKQRAIWLQQDGASCHTSAETTAWLKRRGVEALNGWPARSPDLNPVENLWAIVSAKVAKRGPMAEQELRKFVKEEWENIPQATIDKLVLSFRGRVQKCVAAEGGHIVL
jgi:hypothetical protein